MATNKISLDAAYTEHANESLQMARELWAIRPDLPPWQPPPALGTCACMKARNGDTGIICPVHGYMAPMQATC